MELFQANRQWATRPADQRFPSLEGLLAATQSYARDAREATVMTHSLEAIAEGEEVTVARDPAYPARLTHWAFGQLCTRVGAPAEYLRGLPATLAATNINHGLDLIPPDKQSQLLFHENGGPLVMRAITSDKYARIWNWEVAERLVDLARDGWEPARPDFNQRGDDFPALYASAHDMFAFVRHRGVVIHEAGNADGLQRGVIVENSEVGAGALKLVRFLYRGMCGNHIIWGASDVAEIKVIHVGDAREKFGHYNAYMQQYLDSSASSDEAKIAAAKTIVIGHTKEQVLDKLFGKRVTGLSKKTLEAGYDAVVREEDGDPNTVWGVVNGLTRHSQTIPYADQRTTIDRAAGKLLAATF